MTFENMDESLDGENTQELQKYNPIVRLVKALENCKL